MVYRVELTEDAVIDFEGLDGSLQKLAAKQLRKLQTSPDYGESLGNKYNLDLTGYFKLYFNKKRHRIIYSIHGAGKNKTVEVVAIGARHSLQIYQTASMRNKKPRGPAKTSENATERP